MMSNIYQVIQDDAITVTRLQAFYLLASIDTSHIEHNPDLVVYQINTQIIFIIPWLRPQDYVLYITYSLLPVYITTYTSIDTTLDTVGTYIYICVHIPVYAYIQ